jgi:hypothetical protein
MKKVLIVLMAVAFLGAFAVPAMAADKAEYSFYMSARMTTISYDDDWESGRTPNAFDDRDTVWGWDDNMNRWGFNVKAGNLSGRYEYRADTESRIVWGEWDFGVGKLGIGKTYTPVNLFYSNQIGFDEINMLTYSVYTGADGMIRLRFQGIADVLDFDLAFVQPAYTGGVGGGGIVDGFFAPTNDAAVLGYLANDDLDITLPQIEARLLLNWGAFQAELNGGWVEYDYATAVGGAEREYDIDAWMVGFGMKYSIGPFRFAGTIHTGDNTAVLGHLGAEILQGGVGTCVPWYNAANDNFVDTDRWGWMVLANFKLNDMISFEAGYGESELDYNDPDNVAGVPFDYEQDGWYVQAVIAPTKGVLIIPEVGQVDYNNNPATNLDFGDTFYWGAVWKINF